MKFVVEPKEAETVRLIFDRYVLVSKVNQMIDELLYTVFSKINETPQSELVDYKYNKELNTMKQKLENTEIKLKRAEKEKTALEKERLSEEVGKSAEAQREIEKEHKKVFFSFDMEQYEQGLDDISLKK